MICVIADDLSGAAELGGVALRFGLSAEVQREFHASPDVDVVCIDTDSRSCRARDAGHRVAKVVNQCHSTGMEQVFKKVDSVLRGHVAVELAALAGSLDKSRVLLVPANPSMGRAIRDGEYWVQGKLLHQTGFALDPEYPVGSSTLVTLLGSESDWPVYVLKPGEQMPPRGIVVGESSDSAHVRGWARALDGAAVPAGAADFFHAVLTELGCQPVERPKMETDFSLSESILFVCGSISDEARSFCHRAEQRAWPVLRMPDGVFHGAPRKEPSLEPWIAATCAALGERGRAVVAIDRPPVRQPGLSQRLGAHMGALVKGVMEECPVTSIFAEGGATAAAVVGQLGWTRLGVEQELGPGIVSMRALGAAGPWFTIKPGSYPWPDWVINLRTH